MRTPFTILLLGSAFLCSAQQTPPPAQQAPTPLDQAATIRSSSQEVLLDVVVRDKKGRVVKDITAKDLIVTDDGEKQNIRSFRLSGGSEMVGDTVVAGGKGPGGAPGGGSVTSSLDPLRQIRIVTLVFGGLSPDGRNNARIAINDLLKNEAGPNLFYAVFSIDNQLSILQQYTTNKDLVRKAVARVTSVSDTLFKSESDQIEQEVKTLAVQDTATADVAAPAGAAPDGGALASQALARLTLNMMQFSQTMDRTLGGRSTLYALEALIGQQYRLPGRKTIIFLCEGMYIPPEYDAEFHTLIGNANRANVSVYGVDVRSLGSYSLNSSGGALLSQSTAGSRSAQTQRSGPVTYDQATAIERSAEAIQANTQNTLDVFSQETGGFMVANTNDLSTRLHRVTEDIDSHYELSYSPDIRTYDGRFRKISVTINRPDVKVQTRSGYYALPFSPGESLVSYEMPMLNALNAQALPQAIAFRSSGLHFKSATGQPLGVVVLDVPLEGIEFTRDEQKKVYQTHFSVLALLKDSQGTVVRKFSQDVPRQGPLDKAEAFKMGHFIYSQNAPLAPGEYTLETAVTDQKTGKISARKSSIVVPPAADALGISSIVRVRNFTPKGANEPASLTEDPFAVSTGKISPGLDDSVKGGAGQTASFFFSVYVPAGTKTAPELNMEFYKGGQLLGRGAPPLTPPDSNGVIPYIATIPLDSFKTGQYEVRFTVTQDGKTATERTKFTVE
jgi:VWFA-related protein